MVTHYWRQIITGCGLTWLGVDEDATTDWLDVTCVECLTAEEATR